MTDPKRWSEDGDATEQERQLVLAGQAPKLPESERRALWASIALSLPAATSPAPTNPPPAASSGLVAYLTKSLIFLATVAGVGVGVSRLWPHPSPTPQAVAPQVTTAPSPAPAAAAPADSPTPESEAAASPKPAAPLEPKRVPTASQLREESLAVLEARAALRAGNASQSLSLLEQARTRFPRGALGQEREALTIEALAKTGQTAAARRRAEAFLRAHPHSPYVADLRYLTEP